MYHSTVIHKLRIMRARRKGSRTATGDLSIKQLLKQMKDSISLEVEEDFVDGLMGFDTVYFFPTFPNEPLACGRGALLPVTSSSAESGKGIDVFVYTNEFFARTGAKHLFGDDDTTPPELQSPRIGPFFFGLLNEPKVRGVVWDYGQEHSARSTRLSIQRLAAREFSRHLTKADSLNLFVRQSDRRPYVLPSENNHHVVCSFSNEGRGADYIHAVHESDQMALESVSMAPGELFPRLNQLSLDGIVFNPGEYDEILLDASEIRRLAGVCRLPV